MLPTDDGTKSDLMLIDEFRAGDQSSFETLIQRYSDKAYSLATRLTRSEEDAEEVLQDVFVTVYRKIDGFQRKSSFSSWLYRVTVNASFMKLRKKRQDQSISIEEVLPQIQNSIRFKSQDQLEGDVATLRNEVLNALERALGALPEEYRVVFVLRDIDGLTSREVGRVLELSIPAVKSRLHRSRIMVRRQLEQFYQDYSGNVSAGTRVGNY